MKPLFICEFCGEIGTEEEISKHESECIYDYTKRSCFTCKHSENLIVRIKCKLGKEIPEGKIWEQCPSYEKEDKSYTNINKPQRSSIFGGIF